MITSEYTVLRRWFIQNVDSKHFYLKRFHSGMVWCGATTCRLRDFHRIIDRLEAIGYECKYINPYIRRIDVKRSD